MSQKVLAENYYLELWFTRVGDSSSEAEAAVAGALSNSENECLARIESSARRREYLLSRALMRHALSQHYDCAQRNWDIVDRKRAKPEIGNLPAGSFIGLSHSKGLICFALANCPFGVDLEFNQMGRDFPGMAKRFMNDEERRRLVHDEADQADFFYRSWCAKEACYKSLPVDEQEKTLFPGIDYARLRQCQAGRYLREGRIGQFTFAVVSSVRLDTIGCHYFLESDTSLGRLDWRDG